MAAVMRSALAAVCARSRGIDLFQDLLISMARGISQIVVVGLILAVLLKWPWWTSPLLLVVMIAAAGKTSSRRAKEFPGALQVSLYAIGLGAGSTIAVMTAAGVIDHTAAALVPIGSMLIANAMNANALAFDRFRSEVESHIGEIETGLALGAAAPVTVAPYARGALAGGADSSGGQPAIARHRVDSGHHGRHGAVGSLAIVRVDLSVRRAVDDFHLGEPHLPHQHSPDAAARVHRRGTTGAGVSRVEGVV